MTIPNNISQAEENTRIARGMRLLLFTFSTVYLHLIVYRDKENSAEQKVLTNINGNSRLALYQQSLSLVALLAHLLTQMPLAITAHVRSHARPFADTWPGRTSGFRLGAAVTR